MYPEHAQKAAAAAAALAMLVALTGCGSNKLGDDPPVSPSPPPSVPPPSPPPPPPPPPPTNRAPTASAGADLVVQVGQAATLNGGASTDPDGDALDYSWAVVAGAGGALSLADQSSASFTSAAPGTYIIEVTVRDPGNLSSSDVVIVDVRVPRSATAVTLQKLGPSLFEGSAETVAVYLPQAAGPGGIAVTLQSSDIGVLTVPATIDIPEGESTSAFHVDGIAAGTADIQALAPGIDPSSISYTVEPLALDLVKADGPHGVLVGGNTTLTVRLHNPAPAGGARATFDLSDPARATLSSSSVNFAAGATEGSVTLTGATPGSVRISASLDGGGAGEPLGLMILPAGVVADRGSADLIGSALEAGTITPEQSVVYGIQAAFGDPALPAQFRGNDTGALDSGAAGRLANLRIETMSAGAQEAIGRYLFPPIYRGSWGEGITPVQTKARLAPRAGAADVSCFDNLRGMPRSDTLPHWKFIRTGVFKIWYPSVLGPDVSQFNWYTAAQGEAAAQRVAATINRDFDKLKVVLGDVLRDGGVTCNGGDDAVDVYVTRIGFSAKAQVMPYLPGQCARPGWIWVAPDAIPDARKARNIIGHELVHLFQLRYARPNCDDWRYGILDEATASWAFDHLYKDDKYEHQFLSDDTGTYFYGFGGEWRASPLETGAGGARNCNGYCDYLFFEWLSRKFTPNAIRGVLDAAGSGNPQQAFETGLGGVGGGLEKLWPQFALFMWNDHQSNVQAELNSWERVSSASMRRVVQSESMYIDMNLGGAPKREFGEAMFDKLRQLRDGELPAMSTNYLHLRFTDQNVARVYLTHQASHLKARWPRFKMQAIQKINGQWRQPEDWSGEDEKYYCRDKRAERIEELVLVYSHAIAGTEPFLHEGPTVVQLYEQDVVEPKLTVNNAPCMPWRGTASVTHRNDLGGIIRYSGQATLKLYLLPGQDPEEAEQSPVQVWVPEQGTASMDMNWIDESGCRQTVPTTSGAVKETEGRLFLDFNRGIGTAVFITELPNVTITLDCPDEDPRTTTGPLATPWFGTGLVDRPISVDGRRFEGSFVDTIPATGVRVSYEWHFTAEPEE